MVVGRAETPNSGSTASHALFFLHFLTWTAKIRTVLLANVLEQEVVAVFQDKHVHPKASPSRSEVYSSRDHTRPPRLSFALAMILTMNARRFQRTHPLSGKGSSLRQHSLSTVDGQVRNRAESDLPGSRELLGDAHLKCCIQMYYSLALITKGSVRTLVRSVEESNGAEAWRLIHSRYVRQTLRIDSTL